MRQIGPNEFYSERSQNEFYGGRRRSDGQSRIMVKYRFLMQIQMVNDHPSYNYKLQIMLFWLPFDVVEE